MEIVSLFTKRNKILFYLLKMLKKKGKRTLLIFVVIFEKL